MAWPGEPSRAAEEDAIDRGLPLRVVMVCTGNICRSPLAEQFLASQAREFSLPISVTSAGTHAMLGGKMPEEIGRILLASGESPAPHVPRQLTPEIILGADVILTATREHRKFAVSMAPRSATTTFTLRQFGRLLSGHALLVESGELPPPTSPRNLIRELANIRGLVMPADRPEDDDIADPYHGTVEAYAAAGKMILEDIVALTQALRKL
jgi:protein-tyrosine phosphatase